MSDEHPMSGPPREVHDLDLGDGHWIDWSEFEGKTCGGIITHVSGPGVCSGFFWIDDRFAKANHRSYPIWKLTGTLQKPTLAPSFRCHCGDHGFVREGKWVRA